MVFEQIVSGVIKMLQKTVRSVYIISEDEEENLSGNREQ